MSDIILSQSEYDHLIEEIHKLQARITELTALRDDLVYHVCPALRAEYDEKIVSLERELMAAELYLRQMQRTVEILQSQMNQQQEPSMDEAEKKAKEETREYEEDLKRKAEEAREFKKKWEESQWSKYDQEEREARKNTSSEGPERSAETGEEEESGKDRKEDETADKDETGHSDRSGRDDPSGKSSGKAKEDTTAQKIRKLYRKIVKRLHPDVHPNPTEHEKDLLNQAMKAFQEGNLNELERIWDELSGMDAPEDVFDDTPEGRFRLREMLEKLKVKLQLLELEIEHIKEDFPYRIKAFLEDPVAIEEVRRGMLSKLEHTREMIRQLEALINELREKFQKGGKV